MIERTESPAKAPVISVEMIYPHGIEYAARLQNTLPPPPAHIDVNPAPRSTCITDKPPF